MKKQIDANTLGIIKQCSSLSEEARDIANRLLSSSSSVDNKIDIENINILSTIRNLADKHKFKIPSDTSDKDKLINVLLRLIVKMDSNQSNMVDNLFDSQELEQEAEDDDVSMFSDDLAKEDQEQAEIKENFKDYLIRTKFGDILFTFSNESYWKTLKPSYQKIYSRMLIDESNTLGIDYPSFWSDYL